MIYKFKKIVFLYAILFSSCSKSCTGIVELGSSKMPVLFFIAQKAPENVKLSITNCIEKKSGYQIRFENIADENGIFSAFLQGTAHAGFLSPILFFELNQNMLLKGMLVRQDNSNNLAKAIFIAKYDTWKKAMFEHKIFDINKSLVLLNNYSIAYIEPKNEMGFFLARNYLLKRKIFPKSSVFATNYELMLDLLNKNEVNVGVFSDYWLINNIFKKDNIDLSDFINRKTPKNLIILAVTEALTQKIMLFNNSISENIITNITNAFISCDNITDMSSLFGGQKFIYFNKNLNNEIQKLFNYQKQFPRILVPYKDNNNNE